MIIDSFDKFLENKDKKVDDNSEIDFNKNKSIDESDVLDLRKPLMGANREEEHLDYIKRFLDKLNIKYEVHAISFLDSMSPLFTITMDHPNNGSKIEVMINKKLMSPMMKHIKGGVVNPVRMIDLMDLQNFLIKHWLDVINDKAFKSMNEGWFSKKEFKLDNKDLKKDLTKLSNMNFEKYIKAFAKKFKLEIETLGILNQWVNALRYKGLPCKVYQFINHRNNFKLVILRVLNTKSKYRVVVDKRQDFNDTLQNLRYDESDGYGPLAMINDTDFKNNLTTLKDLIDFIVENDYAGLLNLDNDMKSINEGWFSKDKREFELGSKDLKRDLMKLSKKNFEIYLKAFTKKFDLKFEEITLETGRGIFQYTPSRMYDAKYPISLYKITNPRNYFGIDIGRLRDRIIIDKRSEFIKILINLRTTIPRGGGVAFHIKNSDFKHDINNIKDLMDFLVENDYAGLLNLDNVMKSVNERDLLNTDRFTRSMNEDIVDISKEGDMSLMKVPFEEIINTISKSLNKLGIEYEMLGKSESMDNHKADIFQIIMDGNKKITLEVIQPYGNIDDYVDTTYITFHYYEMNNALSEENRHMIIKRQEVIQNIGDMVSVLKDYPEIINKKVFKNINESHVQINYNFVKN